MKLTETLEDFYTIKVNGMPENLRKEIGHFNVFKLDDFVGNTCKPFPYTRKDFYKISLIIGKNKIHYADKISVIEDQALFFANPQIPYNWEQVDENQTGFFCIFTEAFFNQFGNLKEYPLFQPGGNPIVPISMELAESLKTVYLKMFDEINSDYTFKYDVLRNLVFEIIHLALKTQTVTTSLYSKSNATIRVSSLFLELLERQFPIESISQQINFRSPSEFASQLNVHVNHLNKALKETTGKTTSQIISERIVQEAMILLKQTNWNINEIAWCLGFEELSHFINFFKKNVQLSPKTYRVTEIV
ncbi:helix-turn-helix domain-containing protein [Flavobacterium pectinovorum]|uniref:AraC family transcriptional regulator n=1 Tax=Flavobacterium pectinovorum TaxID=29533 RepID=A0AB36P6G6_9FLAO|nr:helix-turn-helix transcriptional regulator [Flavobacterium pectinovorum]OXB06193.1 AraC family transcriptional regulator [Flavobacterium pectinovorum]SHM97628.1 transcriptional regulator, AraC family [Flavobacterium pectinovorum]